MIDKVPEALRDEFLINHPNAKVLDYAENQGLINSKKIYWEEANVLGIYGIFNIENSEVSWSSDYYMTAGDIEKLIKLSKFF